MDNFRLNKIVAVVFIIVLFSSMVFSISILPTIKQVQGSEGSEPWLEGWDYRKNHTICNATGAGTNYQIKINVDYGSGADSGDAVYLNGSCKSDFGDVRFTDDDGVTELDYWMESKTDSDGAVFWVRVNDDLSSSNATIYVYYGNAEASTTSDGVATFHFFDTFNGESLNTSKWDILTGTPTVTASEVYLQRTDGYEDIMANGGDDDGLSTTREIRAKWRYTQTEGGHGTPTIKFGISETNSTGTNTHFGAWYEYAGGRIYNWLNGGYTYSAANDPDIGSYYSVTRILSDGVQFKSWGAQTCDWTKTGTPDLYSGYTYLGVGWDSGIYVDWIFTRKYVEFEPVHGSWGAEESQSSGGTESWLEGWNYRKSHIITGSSYGNLTDYIFGFKVYKGSGTDGTETYGSTVFGKVYCDDHCRDDFLDIRFTESDGTSVLDLNLMEVNSGNYSYFWVKISVDAYPANKTIYMYYDNGESTEVSIPEEEFFTEIGHGRTQQGDATLSSANSYDGFPTSAGVSIPHNSKSVYWYINHASGFEGRLTMYSSSTKRGETPDILVGSGFTRAGDMFDNSSFEINMTAGWIMGFWRPSGVSTTVQRYLPSSSTSFFRAGYLPVGSSDTFSVNYNYGYWTAVVGYRVVVDPEPTHTSWSAEEESEGSQGSGDAEGWLDGWSYRKNHVITGSKSGNVTEYIFGFKVYKGSGTDGTETLGNTRLGKVYCDNNCRDDFLDIRFTDSDGNTTLDMNLMDVNYGNYSYLWVKVSMDAYPETKTIYMYYDNGESTEASIDEDDFFVEIGHGRTQLGDFASAVNNQDRFPWSAKATTANDCKSVYWYCNVASSFIGKFTVLSGGGITMTKQGETPEFSVGSGLTRVADMFDNPDYALSINSGWILGHYKTGGSNIPSAYVSTTSKYFSGGYLPVYSTETFDVNYNFGYWTALVGCRNVVNPEPAHTSWGEEQQGTQTSEESWLGWNYRKSHTITGSSAGTVTDYVFGFKVYKGSGTDGTETYGNTRFGKIYCGNNCRDDFLDTRFTDSDGNTTLDMNIMNVSSGNYAYFWVKISVDAYPATKTIYIYYGNANATTDLSIAEETFFAEIGHGRTHQGDIGNAVNDIDRFPLGTAVVLSNNSKSVYWYCNVASGFTGRLTVMSGGTTMTKHGETPEFSVGSGLTRVADMFDDAGYELEMNAGWKFGHYKVGGANIPSMTSGSTATYRQGHLLPYATGDFSYSNNFAYWTAIVGYRVVVDPEPTHASWGEEESSCWLPYLSS